MDLSKRPTCPTASACRACRIRALAPTRRTPPTSAFSASTTPIKIKPSARANGRVALAGFQRNGRGHHAGEAVDVATHNHHRAHFGNRPAKRGNQLRSSKRVSAHPRPTGGCASPARHRGTAICSPWRIFARLPHTWRVSAVTTGSTSMRLRQHHRLETEQPAQKTQRARSR